MALALRIGLGGADITGSYEENDPLTHTLFFAV
jgi:hypothetical protein